MPDEHAQEIVEHALSRCATILTRAKLRLRKKGVPLDDPALKVLNLTHNEVRKNYGQIIEEK